MCISYIMHTRKTSLIEGKKKTLVHQVRLAVWVKLLYLCEYSAFIFFLLNFSTHTHKPFQNICVCVCLRLILSFCNKYTIYIPKRLKWLNANKPTHMFFFCLYCTCTVHVHKLMLQTRFMRAKKLYHYNIQRTRRKNMRRRQLSMKICTKIKSDEKEKSIQLSSAICCWWWCVWMTDFFLYIHTKLLSISAHRSRARQLKYVVYVIAICDMRCSVYSKHSGWNAQTYFLYDLYRVSQMYNAFILCIYVYDKIYVREEKLLFTHFQ